MAVIKDYRQLRVYQMAFEAAVEIYELTKKLPAEERYSLTDQNPAVIALGVCQHRRGVAQAALSATLRQQAQRR